jgi:plastocyanin
MLLPFSAQADGLEHKVTQKNKEFSRTTLVIPPGDSVVVKNEDEVVHNLLSTSRGLKLNKLLDPGDEVKIVFKAEGRTIIRCAIHPKMKLTVIVHR